MLSLLDFLFSKKERVKQTPGIQRYNVDLLPDPEGGFVTFIDHQIEIDRLKKEIEAAHERGYNRGYSSGQDSGYSWRL